MASSPCPMGAHRERAGHDRAGSQRADHPGAHAEHQAHDAPQPRRGRAERRVPQTVPVSSGQPDPA
eukprot:6994426-Alexandrium_andersonii.AAC.1